jgi:quinolinate synthase
MASIIPLLTDYEKQNISERQALPEKYLGLSDAEMDARIAAAREKLGNRLVILGHHYQRDEVIKFADYTGDSFKLAVQARPADRQPSGRRLHRLLRRALHG